MDAGAPHTGYPHRLPRPCDNGDGRSVPERQETMRATRKRRLPALLAAVLIFALAAGCGGRTTPASSTASEGRELVDSRETWPEESAGAVSSSGETDPSSPTSAASGPTQPGRTTAKTTASAKPPSGKPTSGESTPSSSGTITNGSYPPLGKNIMPIGAWVAPPRAGVKNNNPSFINDAQYKMLRDSGINLIYGLYETANDQLDDVQKSLDLCQKYGIKYLVRDSNTNEPDEELMRAALKKYAKHPAFAGLKVQDEPGVNSFERFGDAHPIFQKLLPDKYFYINLLPSYATPAQLQYGAATTQTSGSITFEQYLDAYIKTVKPKFLSYDYYALTEKKDFIQTGYFNELSTFRKLGLKNNIPYWVFIQACSFNSLTRRPNEAEILWQVNTSLAYGAKGIQYFCYFTPIEDDIFQGNFIDKNGNKTEIYAYGQKANRQIAAVDDVLMNSVSKGVIVTGTSPDPSIPAADTLTKYGALTGVSHSGAAFLTGCFDYGGKNAFYVVNNSITQSGTVTLRFEKSVSGSRVIDGAKTTFSGSSLSLTLKAGEGALVTLS